jgi:hypothetical protein
MNMYIKLDENNNPINHPILENNFIEAYPEIDINNLPPTFAKFIRVAQPIPAVYSVYVNSTYEWDGDVVKDTHHFRDMTPEEKQAKQDFHKSEFSLVGFDSWTFDEETCMFIPPIPQPTDGQVWNWREATGEWIVIPLATYPQDGKIYKFDIVNEIWVEFNSTSV